MMLTKWLKYCLIFVSALLLISLFIISLLLFTHSGNKTILKGVKSFESRLSIDLVEGSLLNSPTFENIAWVDGDTEINITTANYKFDWSCLMDRLCLSTFYVDGISIIIPESDEKSEVEDEVDPAPLVIDIPIELIISNIEISNLYFAMGDLSVDLDKISLSADALNDNISLASQISGLQITLPDSVAENIQVPVSNEAKKLKNLTIQSIPAILTGEMLPTVRLPLNLDIKPIIVNDFKIIQNQQSIFELNSLETELSFADTLLSINKLELDLPETVLNLNGNINFIERYPLDIIIDGRVKNIKQLEQQELLNGIKYKLVSNGDLSDLNSKLILSNKVNLALETHVDLFTENLPHRIDLSWNNLQWPLNGDYEYKTNLGHFSSKGNLNSFKVILESDYLLTNLPSGNISLKTEGDLQHLTVESLNVESLSGNIDFSGLLSWSEKLTWLGDLRINDIDLAPLNTEYDGHFSGDIKQNVELTLYENSAPDWQFDFPQLAINGELLSRPLTLGGRVSGDNQSGITFDNLTVNNAENTVIVNGLLAEQNDLTLKLDIVDIGSAVIGTKGDLKGDVYVSGPADKLSIKSKLNSTGLLYDTYEVDNVSLDSRLVLEEIPQVELSLQTEHLSLDNQLIDKLNIEISNNSSEENTVQHTIDLLVNSEMISTDLQVLLTQNNKELLTQLNQAVVKVPQQTLTLSTPFDVIYQQETIDISPHCWLISTDNASNSGNLCIKKFNAGESGNVVVDLNGYSLDIANQYLPEQLRVMGNISSDADIKWEKAAKPIFTVNLLSQDMLFKINNDSESFTDYPMETFNINLTGDQDNLEIVATLFADNLLDFSVNGSVQPYLEKPTINAQISSKFPDFSLFKPIVNMFEELQGSLNSGVTVSGDLYKPSVNGDVVVKNGEISSPDLPIKISELGAVIEINDSVATLLGSFNSNDINTIVGKSASVPLITNTLNIFDKSFKRVSSNFVDIKENSKIVKEGANKNPGIAFIKGQLDWTDKLVGNAHVYAHKLEVYDYGKIDLLLSPDIYLIVDDHVSIKGDLFIDKGKIVVKELPAGAISESKDIVVIDVEKENTAEDLPVIIDLGLDLGDSFQLVAIGLDTFIDGKLLIKKQLKKDLTINGSLQLTDGSYRALGQQLVLQDSRVVFQGAPEEPYLQIEAVRDSSKIEDDVTAGVRVTGTPDELELIIFSEPAMAQQEALSYLTRGKGLDSNSDGGTMANMLIDLAAGQSDGIMSNIGEEIGIKDLSLESSGTGDEQSVGIRGEIAPGVEVSYGVGVFDSFSVLSLRYEVFERFYIEASSSVYQAIDAYYEWDWD